MYTGAWAEKIKDRLLRVMKLSGGEYHSKEFGLDFI